MIRNRAQSKAKTILKNRHLIEYRIYHAMEDIAELPKANRRSAAITILTQKYREEWLDIYHKTMIEEGYPYRKMNSK